MKPYVFDANAIHAFQTERVSGSEGTATSAVKKVFSENCIALDDGGLCLSEWISCAAHRFPFALQDWVNDQLIEGKIRLFALSDNSSRKALMEVGLPKDDHKWVRLAVGCDGKIIVSKDIDFFEPALKKASAKVKEAAKRAGGGKCCKVLRKKFGIRVLALADV